MARRGGSISLFYLIRNIKPEVPENPDEFLKELKLERGINTDLPKIPDDLIEMNELTWFADQGYDVHEAVWCFETMIAEYEEVSVSLIMLPRNVQYFSETDSVEDDTNKLRTSLTDGALS